MLTILHTEASLGWGGQEIRILQESLGMIRRGKRVLLAASEDSSIFKRTAGSDIRTFPVNFWKKDPRSIMNMLSLLGREKVDIVNTHSSSDSWVTTIAARLLGARPRIIRTRHLSTAIGRSYLSRLIYDKLPDAVITTGEEIRQRMIHDNGFNGAKIHSIPTGIDLNRFDPAKVKPAFYQRGFCVGMIGVLRSWKGHQYLLKAVPGICEEIPDAYFYIVGEGPQKRNIKNLISRMSLSDRVFMLGHREDIPEVLSSLHLLVQPSYENEGVPQSVLQAMAMEKPVVAADAGAIKEVVINGETGFLIAPRNEREIAQKVIELQRSPEMSRTLGRKGRLLVEREYSMEGMLDRVEELYSRLLARG